MYHFFYIYSSKLILTIHRSIHNSECLPCLSFSLVCLEILPHPPRFCSSVTPHWSSQTLTLPLPELSWQERVSKFLALVDPSIRALFPMSLQLFVHKHTSLRQAMSFVGQEPSLICLWNLDTLHSSGYMFGTDKNLNEKNKWPIDKLYYSLVFLWGFPSSRESNMVSPSASQNLPVMWRRRFCCPGTISETEGKARGQENSRWGVTNVFFFREITCWPCHLRPGGIIVDSLTFVLQKVNIPSTELKTIRRQKEGGNLTLPFTIALRIFSHSIVPP